MYIKILRRRYSFGELYILRRSLLKILLCPKKILNFFLVKISLLFKIDKCLGLPFNINIEPTGSCNYQCIKCARFSDSHVDDGSVFDNKNMPLSYYRKIIDDIGNTLLTLRLWHNSEPLLNKDLFLMIEYAKKKDIIVAVNSNLSLLTPEGAEELIRLGLDYLVVSFDGASRRTYNLYHGRDYFNRVLSNIHTLVTTKKEFRSPLPFVELQFIVMRENEKEIGEMKRLASELGVDKLSYLKLDATNINFNKFESIHSDGDILPKYKKFCLDINEINRIKLCRNPWEGVVICYSGAILPCVGDLGQQHIMGRLYPDNRRGSFRKIWNNDKYRTFRRENASNINRIDICFNCAQRNNNIKDQILLNGKV